MVKSCCVLGCTQRYSKNSGISFHRFPAESELKEIWVKALARHDWQPSYHSLVCGKHFLTGRPSSDPNHPDFTPNIFPHVSMHHKYRTTYTKRLLLMSDNITPHQPVHPLLAAQVCDENQSGTSNSTSDGSQKRSATSSSSSKKKKKTIQARRILPPPRKSATAVPPLSNEQLLCAVQLPISQESGGSKQSGSSLSVEVGQFLLMQRLTEQGLQVQEEMKTQLRKQQNEINLLQVQVEMLKEKNAKLLKEPKQSSRDVMSEFYLTDKIRCMYYTGVPNMESFQWLVHILENDIQKHPLKLSIQKQLLVVLMKIKLDLQHIDLGYRFGVAPCTICRIIKVWTPVLISNVTTFLQNPEKDSILKMLLQEDISNDDVLLWLDRLLIKALNFISPNKNKLTVEIETVNDTQIIEEYDAIETIVVNITETPEISNECTIGTIGTI